MLELIPHGTKINFMKYKWVMVPMSFILTVIALVIIYQKGFNYGVDFAGGIELVIKLPEASTTDVEKLRQSFLKMGITDASVQEFGGKTNRKESEYIVHFASDLTNETQVRAHIEKALEPLSPTGEKLVVNFRFTGLEKAYLTLSKPVPLAPLQAAVKGIPFGLLEMTGFERFGRESSNEYQLTFQSVSKLILRELVKDFSGTVEIEKVDFVGAKVGKDLKVSAIMSLLITALLIFLYIFIRFDLAYAPGVIRSLIHDVTITAGCFALFRFEFDLTIVAALLTLAGYSNHDTIIIYDRIREVSKHLRGKSFEEIINISINQTLSRSIVTSMTVFISALALFLWGGPALHGFSIALLIGVFVATYSSVFVAAPAILFTTWLKERKTRLKKAA